MSNYELELRKQKQFSTVKNLIWISITGSFAVLMVTTALSLTMSSTDIFQVTCMLSGVILLCITLLISSSGLSVIHPVIGGVSDSKSGDRYKTLINKRNRGVTSAGMLVILSALLIPALMLLIAAFFIQPTEIILIISTALFVTSLITGRKLTVFILHKLQIGV